MSKFTWDHIHYRCASPDLLAAFFVDLFDATEEGRQDTPNGLRIILAIDGLRLFLEAASPDALLPPPAPHRGLEHIGLVVGNLDKVAAEIRQKGAIFWKEPAVMRPGLKIAFVQGPEGVLVELLERSAP